MNRSFQRRRNRKNAGLGGEEVNTIDAPVLRALVSEIALVSTEVERRPRGPVRCLHLDQPRTTTVVERQNIVPRAVSVLSRDPSNLASEICSVRIPEVPAFYIDDERFTSLSQCAVPIIALDRIELSHKAVKAVWDCLRVRREHRSVDEYRRLGNCMRFGRRDAVEERRVFGQTAVDRIEDRGLIVPFGDITRYSR